MPKKLWTRIVAGIGTVITIGSVIMGWVWVDSHFGKAYMVENNAIDIKINSIKDNIRWYQDQMAFIMSRCGVGDPSQLRPHTYENYKSYEVKKQELEKQLEYLFQKKKS